MSRFEFDLENDEAVIVEGMSPFAADLFSAGRTYPVLDAATETPAEVQIQAATGVTMEQINGVVSHMAGAAIRSTEIMR